MYSQLYRPFTLDELTFNKDLSLILKNKNLQNYIIYGNESSGKMTRVYCHLENKFGKSVYNTKLNTYLLNKTIEITYKSSIYHIEISPGDYGTNDKFIISEFLNEFSMIKNFFYHKKIFVIKSVDKLTKKAQMELLKLIEQKNKYIQFMMTCSNMNKIILPLKSIFLLLRNPSPKNADVSNIIKNISNKTNLKVSQRAINIIIENSKQLSNNISIINVINIFQLTYITGKYIKYDINFTQYIDELIDLCEKKLIKTDKNKTDKNDDANELNMKVFEKMRELIYTIYISNINMSTVIKYIMNYLINKEQNLNRKIEIINNATKYELLMNLGNKEPLYLETFLLNVYLTV